MLRAALTTCISPRLRRLRFTLFAIIFPLFLRSSYISLSSQNVPEGQTSLTLTSPANGTWYWSVKPRNNAYTSSSMTTQSFVACFGVRFALATAAPATVYSTNGVSAAINFTWTTSGWSPSCASSIQESMLKYKIYVGKNTTPDTLLAEDIDSTFFEATLGVGTWNWIFVPVLNGEDLDASEVFQLTVTYCSDGIAQFPEEECDGGDGCLSDCTCGPLWLPVGSASLSCVPSAFALSPQRNLPHMLSSPQSVETTPLLETRNATPDLDAHQCAPATRVLAGIQKASIKKTARHVRGVSNSNSSHSSQFVSRLRRQHHRRNGRL